MKKERDIKTIIKTALDENGLSYKDLCEITGRSESTVFKWLNGTLTPDGLAIVQLAGALKGSRKKIPRELIRAQMATLATSSAWARRNKTEYDHYQITGERIRQKTNWFYFNGNRMTRQQIATTTGLKYPLIYSRTKNMKDNSDVTEILLEKKTRGRKRKVEN